MSTFQAFDLPQPLYAALANMHHTTPTPIQQQAIPMVMSGQDLVGIAQTGTGKTAAFGIPLIVALLKNPEARSLIMAPTRELATQIQDVLLKLAAGYPNLKTALLIGGASMHWQNRALQRQPRIIVATPGRLIDHIEHHTVSLDKMSFVVLDEADRMLDIGFEPQLRRVFQYLPKQRQTLLFSATFPKEIERLAARYLRNPGRVTVGEVTRAVERIQQAFVKTTNQQKNETLIKELHERQGSVLIFTRTKHRTDRLTRLLSQSGFKADRIHGNRTQSQRTRVIEAFREQKFRILVATDIASRGLDIPHIQHVINYDLPQVPEDYIHRIGRTARAGAAGESLCLLTPEDNKQWRELSRHLEDLRG